MNIKTGYAALLVLILIGCPPCFAAMGSASFSIPANVISGGGASMGSASFHSNATLGQPSPLAMAASTSYDLYPGFWYTMTMSGCIWDLEPDGDVDGADLHLFVHPPYNASDIEGFGSEFGRTDCF